MFPDDIERVMKMEGFKMENIMTRRTGPELLSVLKFVRSDNIIC